MKLFDLLQESIETQRVLTTDDHKLGMVYSQMLNCFVWCDRDGRVIEESNGSFGYKRVILSPKLWEKDNWYLI